MTFVREAPLIGHGTGSIEDLFRRSAIGETGATGVVTNNPHSQIFGSAIHRALRSLPHRGLDRLDRHGCRR